MSPGGDTPAQCVTLWALTNPLGANAVGAIPVALNLADPSYFRGSARQRCAGSEQRNTRGTYPDVDLSDREAGHADHERGNSQRHEKQTGTFGGGRRLPGQRLGDVLVVDNRIHHASRLPESRAEKRRRPHRNPVRMLARDRFVRPVERLHGRGDVGCGRGQRVYRF